MIRQPLVAALGLALGLPALALAQETAPQMYFVQQIHAKPAHLFEYEAALQEFVGRVREAAPPASELAFFAYSSAAGGYYFVVPIAGLGDLEARGAALNAAINKGDPGAMDRLEEKMGPMEDHMEATFVVHRPDLSYNPENAAVTAETGEVAMFYYYKVVPGMIDEFEAGAKEYVRLYTENSIDRAFNLFQFMTGEDLPMFVLVEYGKNEADIFESGRAIEAKLGPAGMQALQSVLPSVRGLEMDLVRVRHDLAYVPAM